MKLIYRLLGVAARSGERLSHTRINFIPLNLGLMVILGMFAFAGLGGMSVSASNGDKPRAVSISEVLDHKHSAASYVTVKGLLVHGMGFQATRKSKYNNENEVEASYIPLVDIKGKRALLVKRDGQDNDNLDPQELEITGMLSTLESGLKSKLSEMGGEVEGVPFDMEYMLEEGSSPGSFVSWALLAVGCGIPFALMTVTFLKKYVVFRAMGSPQSLTGGAASSFAPTPPPLPGEEPALDLRVTGHFRLDEKNAKRFLNVPAAMGKLDTGEIALVSNIDASSKFFGFTTAERAGYWAILMPPSGLQGLTYGYLYDGFAERPALRLNYTDATNGKRLDTILSFASEQERATAITELNRMAGYSLATA